MRSAKQMNKSFCQAEARRYKLNFTPVLSGTSIVKALYIECIYIYHSGLMLVIPVQRPVGPGCFLLLISAATTATSTTQLSPFLLLSTVSKTTASLLHPTIYSVM